MQQYNTYENVDTTFKSRSHPSLKLIDPCRRPRTIMSVATRNPFALMDESRPSTPPLPAKPAPAPFRSSTTTMFTTSTTSKVQYRSLGKSGLKVSVPILGAGSFGTSKWASWVLDEEPSIEIMKAAWDLGINTIDTANTYSNGESECLIPKFIKRVCFTVS